MDYFSCLQVGVVTYGSGAKNQVYLNQYRTQNDLVGALSGITFTGGSANAAPAITMATTEGFSAQHGGRQGVPHVIIHVTNGPSTDGAATRKVPSSNLLRSSRFFFICLSSLHCPE